MGLNEVLDTLKFGKTFVGIEHSTFNGCDYYFKSVLIKRKNNLDYKETSRFDSLDNLVSSLSKNAWAQVVINTNHVITKRLKSSNNKEDTQLVLIAFPNIDLDAFYYQIIIGDQFCFVSICRKAHVEDIISLYKNYNIYITDISLGCLPIANVLEYIDSRTIITSNTTTTNENNQLQSINHEKPKNPRTYDLHGIEVENDFILSTSILIGSLTKSLDSRHNFIIGSWLNEYIQKRFQTVFVKSFGLLLLTALLINFLFFNHYFSEVNDLEQIAEVNSNYKTRLLSLNNVVSEKEKIVTVLQSSSSSKSSFYLSSVIDIMPESISLEEFNYQPLLKKIKENKPIELRENSIIISGSSSDSDLFSKWVAQLDELEWVENVDIHEYGSNSRLVQNFEILVALVE